MTWVAANEVPQGYHLVDSRGTFIPGVVGYDDETEEVELLVTSIEYTEEGKVKEVKAVMTEFDFGMQSHDGTPRLVPLTVRVKIRGCKLEKK